MNLFSIPAGAPFLDTLAEALLGGGLGFALAPDDPLALARTTVFLPTRRAARAFAATLAARRGGGAVLLPRIVPLGDVDAAETAALAGAAGAIESGREAPIDDLRRHFLLTTLVDAWGRSIDRAHLRLDSAEAGLVPSSLAEAFGLAGELAALLDQIQTEEVPIERLGALDAARFDEIWRLNASFLDIVARTWPAILAERGVCDPVTFRSRMLAAERLRLERGLFRGPVVAAGSTGSVRATAHLLAAIARRQNGAVVLPDLDHDLADPDWDAIGQEPAPSHPQAALHRLLAAIGAARSDVTRLGALPPALAPRRALLREAMLPAGRTAAWALLAGALTGHGGGLGAVTILEATDEREEALAIAVALRRTLETPGATAALVTPDRGLAERVGVELGRWNIAIDDSAGLPLGRAPAGALARALLEAVRSGLEPAAMVALYGHRLCRLGRARRALEHAAGTLEIAAWRGETVAPGAAGLRASIAGAAALRDEGHAPQPRRRLSDAELAAATALLDDTLAALEPLRAALDEPVLATIAAAWRAALATVSADETGAALAFIGDDGEALSGLLDEIDAAAESAPPGGTARDWIAILAGLIDARVVRRAGAAHPRLHIWGLIEARLLRADHLVLGGLAETVWPPGAVTDAFLNRPMRAELGLSPPERRIGQTAHDFVQAMLAPEVTLARARKLGEAETIPSRFWQRLQAVAPAPEWRDAVARGTHLIGLARHLSAPSALRPVARPNPKPPAALQPRSLSVTAVETLYRDPYKIYAQRILGLDELPDLLADPTQADRGTLIHAIVEEFTRANPVVFPQDAFAQLLRIGRVHFARFAGTPEVEAFWWPRFRLAAGYFESWEQERRPDLSRVLVEQTTAHVWTLADGTPFRLSGRADRVELGRDGRLRIIDLKTGSVPSPKQVERGLAPQLTLEAELAARAGFSPDVAPAPVEAVFYRKFDHRADAWKNIKPLAFGGQSLADVAAEHFRLFAEHLEKLRIGDEGFLSRRAPQLTSYASGYDHLARVKEWSATGSGANTAEEA